MKEDHVNVKDKGWRELCEAASREHDPEKLLKLITALNNTLEQMAEREKANRTCAVAPKECSGRRTISVVPA